MVPQLAVVLGFVAFLVALAVRFRQGRYRAWSYWLAVAMVGIAAPMATGRMFSTFSSPRRTAMPGYKGRRRRRT
ncbi:hypothetical protein ABZ904_45380 [Streptomyces sp. NPDC046900]|uniref:hypothetical protein n=1 Tax=Streptomyces sp. NPDC046900 TaxID=3155473 RepID=UPI0033E186B6